MTPDQVKAIIERWRDWVATERAAMPKTTAPSSAWVAFVGAIDVCADQLADLLHATELDTAAREGK